jgi:hypothetical protein
MSSSSLRARRVSWFACRGLTTTNETAEAITIPKSSMSTIGSFREHPLGFLPPFPGSHSRGVRVPILLLLIPETPR